jgi:hypothetical protein
LAPSAHAIRTNETLVGKRIPAAFIGALPLG